MRGPVGSILVLALTLAQAPGCAPRRAPETTSGPGAGAGLVYVYLQPLADAAGGLRVEVSAVGAVDSDEATHGLRLEHPSVDGTQPRRQRLLAAGSLPPGTYRGLMFQVRSASTQRDGVRAMLATDATPRFEAQSFTVEAGRARVLTLSLDVGRAVVDGLAFEPAFGIGAPTATELAPAAVAVASVPGSDALIVFHKLTGEVFDVLRTGADPRGVVYDAARSRAYVACAGADTVEAFDLIRGFREQSFPLQFADQPNGLTLSRDGQTLIVSNPGSNSLTVLDAPTLAQRFRLNVGREPVASLLDSAERRLFVFQTTDDSVSVVDLARRAVVATLATETGPVYGAFADRGRRLVVIHRDSPYLTQITLDDLRVERGVYVGSGSVAVAVDARTDRIFLGREGTRAVEVFNPGSALPIDTLDTGADVAFLEIDDDSQQLYAVLPAIRQIRALRISGGDFTASTDVGGESLWLDVAGGGR